MAELNDLLEKNPESREIFEKNREKLDQIGRRGTRKPADCGVASPYSGRRGQLGRWRGNFQSE